MKTLKKFMVVSLSLVLFSGCAKFHTGTVVVEEGKENAKKSNINVEYIVVEEKDKDTLIKNIKEGKGAVITRSRYDDNKEKNNGNDDNKDDDKNSDN